MKTKCMLIGPKMLVPSHKKIWTSLSLLETQTQSWSKWILIHRFVPLRLLSISSQIRRNWDIYWLKVAQTSGTLKVKNSQYLERNRSHILFELESGDIGFLEGGKLENPKKNPRSNARTNNKLNWPAYDTGPESNPGLIGGGERYPSREHPSSSEAIA